MDLKNLPFTKEGIFTKFFHLKSFNKIFSVNFILQSSLTPKSTIIGFCNISRDLRHIKTFLTQTSVTQVVSCTRFCYSFFLSRLRGNGPYDRRTVCVSPSLVRWRNRQKSHCNGKGRFVSFSTGNFRRRTSVWTNSTRTKRKYVL